MKEIKGERITLPMHPISSNPTIKFNDLKFKKFDVLGNIRDRMPQPNSCYEDIPDD